MVYPVEGFEGIVWTDVESNGTHPLLLGSKLLQVACVITDTDLNVLDASGFDAVVSYTEDEARELYDAAPPVVQNMHTETGLWDRIVNEGSSVEVIDAQFLDYVKEFFPNPKTAWFGGNSIKLDRDFAEVFLPNFYAHVHYRSVDVSGIAGLARAWYDVSFVKRKSHDATDDIRESIAELKFLREKAFR